MGVAVRVKIDGYLGMQGHHMASFDGCSGWSEYDVRQSTGLCRQRTEISDASTQMLQQVSNSSNNSMQ
jgi:hypothetical protein